MRSIGTQSTRSRWTRRCAAILLAVAIAAAPAFAQESPLAHGPQPFAVTGVGPKNLTFGKVDLKVTGTGFVKGATIILGQSSLPTHFQSSKQLTAKTSLAPIPGDTYAVMVMNGDGKLSPLFPLVVGVRKPKVSYAAAFRFLEQASWGPDVADVIALQQTGFSSW